MAEPIDVLLYGLGAYAFLTRIMCICTDKRSIGSFYAFILHRADRVRLTVVARSNYDAVVKNVRPSKPSMIWHTVKEKNGAKRIGHPNHKHESWTAYFSSGSRYAPYVQPHP
jgi:hypothetical protein